MQYFRENAGTCVPVAVPLANPTTETERLVDSSGATMANSKRNMFTKRIPKTKLFPNKTMASRDAFDLDQLFDSSDDEPLLPPRKRVLPDQPRSGSPMTPLVCVPKSSEETSQLPACTDDELPLAIPVKKRKYNIDNLLAETVLQEPIDNGQPVEQRCMESDNTEDYNYLKSGPSTSMFNSTFNEVLETNPPSPFNSYSDKTEPYEYSATSPNSSRGSNSFSPLPSTSRDFETFQKNDLLLQECLRADDDRNEADKQIPNTCDKGNRDDDEVQIIEVPVETIIVDDNDDEIELVSYSNIPKYTPNLEDPMVTIDDILGGFCDNFDNSDCEIIDVDNVIAENNALLEKIKQKNEPLDLTRQCLQPIRQESPMQLLDMDTSTITASSFDGPTRSSDHRTETGETMSIIIEDFFKTNPPVTAESSSSLNTICCTLSNILDHMSNILTDTPIMGTNDTRKGSKQHLNNYANKLTVTDTVDLDEVWRSQPQSNFVPAVNSFLPPRPAPVIEKPQQNIPTAQALPAPTSNSNVQTLLGNSTSMDNNEKSTRPILECPICMEHLTSKPIASTICGHIFCMACIQKALKAPGGKKCPTCRHPFTKKGPSFHPLFL